MRLKGVPDHLDEEACVLADCKNFSRLHEPLYGLALGCSARYADGNNWVVSVRDGVDLEDGALLGLSSEDVAMVLGDGSFACSLSIGNDSFKDNFCLSRYENIVHLALGHFDGTPRKCPDKVCLIDVLR